MKALVGAFNQEKALVGAFSVIVKPVMEPMDRFAAQLWLQGLPAVCCDIIVRTEAGICDGIGDLPSNPRTRILEPRVTPRTLGTWPRKRVVCSRYPLGGEVRENKYLDEDDADVPITSSPLPSFLRRT